MARQPDSAEYRTPQIVTIGDVADLTGALGTPTRDNHGSLGDPAYHNAAPDDGEIDLED